MPSCRKERSVTSKSSATVGTPAQNARSVLDEIEDYLEQRQDIRDRGDGSQGANEEMSLLSDLRWWRSAARTQSEKRLTGDLVTDVIGILESKPDRSPAWAEWVWWEAGPDGGFRVGPRDKGCIAIVFTIEEAQELCKTVNTAMRALLAERGEMALKLAGAECFIEEQRKKGNIK